MRTGFTKKRVGTLTLGEKLRLLRTDKRISLNEISRVTKIQVAYLEALEDGNYKNLPADVYVKGFLRSYAEFLGVDDSILVRLYEKEKDIRKNLEENKNPGKNKETIRPINISSFVFTPRKLVLAVIIVSVVGAFVYLYNELGSFADTPRLVILSPRQNAEIEENSALVEGATDKDSKVIINDQPVLVDDDGKFRQEITLQSGVNFINVRSINRFEKSAEETLQVRCQYQEKEVSPISGENEGEKVEEAANNLEEDTLVLELSVEPGPVWLSVEADGQLIFSGNMLSGAVQVFRAKEKILVSSGNGQATKIKLNGKDLGSLSEEEGAVKKKVFDKNTSE